MSYIGYHWTVHYKWTIAWIWIISWYSCSKMCSQNVKIHTFLSEKSLFLVLWKYWPSILFLASFHKRNNEFDCSRSVCLVGKNTGDSPVEIKSLWWANGSKGSLDSASELWKSSVNGVLGGSLSISGPGDTSVPSCSLHTCKIYQAKEVLPPHFCYRNGSKCPPHS